MGYASSCHDVPERQKITNPHDPVNVAHAARIGAELGADVVKTVYTGDPDSFRDVVRAVLCLW